MVAKYEQMGYIYVVIGILINLPWLMLLNMVRSDLMYDPNADI
jgi:hypothetical protein